MRWLGVCVCVCVWSHNAVLFLRVLPSVTLALFAPCAVCPLRWQIAGTGKDGRVLKGDIVGFLRGDAPAAVPSGRAPARHQLGGVSSEPSAPASPAPAPTPAAAPVAKADTVVPVKGACCSLHGCCVAGARCSVWQVRGGGGDGRPGGGGAYRGWSHCPYLSPVSPGPATAPHSLLLCPCSLDGQASSAPWSSP